jgi:hypothetical protein
MCIRLILKGVYKAKTAICYIIFNNSVLSALKLINMLLLSLKMMIYGFFNMVNFLYEISSRASGVRKLSLHLFYYMGALV